jgi:general secretion pathway protein G
MRFSLPTRNYAQPEVKQHASGTSPPRRRSGEQGFTLLELIIVVGIIIILATLSAGRYEHSLDRARESALSQDLSEMRKAIQNYTLDKEAAPNSLDDLVQASYLGQVPQDPITHQHYWNTDPCTMVMDIDQKSAGGICDVHSTSDKISPFENTPYSSW